jgi:kumamolisin
VQPEILGPVDPDQRVEVSIVLRPRHTLSDVQTPETPLSREQFDVEYGADPADIATVEAFAHQHRLKVLEASQSPSTVRVAGRGW